jgi:hypothetical protein
MLTTEAESSGRWLITRVAEEAELVGEPLGDRDRQLLGTSIFDLGDGDRADVLELNNRVVPLVRSAVERAKRNGAPADLVRRGLRIPTEWRVNYQVVFASELPWPISAILQNAFLNNAPGGERRKWKSR